ncbi:MAG: polysaccharide biosynthesis C-terminal domain-containing protein [Chthonomonadales bacterium]
MSFEEPIVVQQPESRVTKNAIIYSLGQIISWCITFLTISIIPRYLGEGALGQAAIAGTAVATVAAAVGFSIERYLIAEIARAGDGAERIIRAVMGLRLVSAPLIILGSCIILGRTNVYPLIWILGSIHMSIFILNSIGDPLRSTLAGWENAKTVTLIDLMATFGSLLAIPLMFFGIIGVTSVGVIISVSVLAVRTNQVSKRISLRPTFDLPLWKTLIKGAAGFYVVDLVVALYGFSSIFVLRHFSDEPTVGVFGLAIRLQGTFLFLPTALGFALLPSLARMAEVGGDEFKDMQRRVMGIMIVMGLPVGVMVFVLAESFTHFLYGYNKFQGLPQALQACAFNLIPLYISSMLYQFLVAQKKNAIWSIFLLVTVGINYVCAIFFVPYTVRVYGNGAIGAILALVVAEVCTTIMAIIVLKNIPFNKEIILRVGRAILATFLMFLVLWPLRKMFILIPFTLGGTVFVLAAWKLHVLGKEEQQKLITIISKGIRRFRKQAAAS